MVFFQLPIQPFFSRWVAITSVLGLVTITPPAFTQPSPDTKPTESATPATEITPEATKPEPDAAITPQNPSIPVDELRLRSLPLTRDQLEIEAAGWLKILQDQNETISAAEIAVQRQKQGADSFTSPEPPNPSAFDQKVQQYIQLDRSTLVARVTELQAERTAIVDRFMAVLAACRRKFSI